ncbi:MAG: acyl-CoA desaturase [Actinomycetota bacterium]|nr:MAG: acyl-CoA desaturase [Actinomycetota bacterium]
MTMTPEMNDDVTAEDLALTGHAYAAAGTIPERASNSDEVQSVSERILVGVFIGVPLLALVLAVPFAWGWGIGWSDVALFAVFYLIAGLGITVGFHRYFTHGSFRANRGLRIALAVAGSTAIQGPVVRWVADHRKHHAFSDDDGDPHSPWRYGSSPWALTKGLLYSHMGWLFDVEQTPQRKYAPDLLRDPDLVKISRLFPYLVAATLLLPAVLGGLITWSWQGALTGFFWAGLVRIALLHHVTWSINSICHVWGKHPFRSRDHSGNVAWLAIPSFGESWHNLHHALPTSARHGALRGQLDISARTIALFEKAGWATDVKWPQPERLEAKRVPG